MQRRRGASALLRRARLARVRLDPELILFLYVPLAVLLLGFVLPIATIVVKASGWSVFSDKYYIDLSSDAFRNFVTVKTLETPKGRLVRIIFSGFDFGVIGNSIANAALVTLTAAFIGTVAALLIGLYRFPGRRVFAILAYMPLLIAPFVNAYVIRRFIYPAFTGNTLSSILSAVTEPLTGTRVVLGFKDQAGVFIAQVLMFYPIVYINALAALAALDATLIEQAINLGAKGLRLIRSIILPLVLPGILAGSTLVFILSMEDVGAPIVFGGNAHKFISYEVYSAISSRATEEVPRVAVLSIIMLVAALTPLAVIRRYLSLRYYARLARGAPRPFRGLRLGRRGLLAAYLLVLPLLVAAAAPQLGVVALAFSSKWTGPWPELLPPDKAFTNFQAVLTIEGVRRSIENSLYYLSNAIVFIALLGFMAGYATARARLPGVGLLDYLASAPLAVPGLVVAFSYFVFFSEHDLGGFLSPNVVPAGVVHLLILAYIVRKIPFTVRSVFTNVIQTPEELEEAARSLGARRARVIARIVLPLTWRGLVAGLLLSSIYILSEVSVSVTLGALGGNIYSENHVGPITFAILNLIQETTTIAGTQPQAKAAALAVMLMILEATVIAVASRLARRGQALVTL